MVRNDPHQVLGVATDASPAAIKAAWRRLAREHHPDLAGSAAERRAATHRMAEINAAYAELRGSPAWRNGGGGRASAGAAGGETHSSAGEPGRGFERPAGPPPPPKTRPVTARLDTTQVFHPRNATTTPAGDGYRHRPRGVRPPQARPEMAEPPRASDPTGPLERLRSRRSRRRPLPSLEEARSRLVAFGKFHGHSLGEIADREPSYVAWLARTITRDPDLLDAARVVAAEAEAWAGAAASTPQAGDPALFAEEPAGFPDDPPDGERAANESEAPRAGRPASILR